MNLTLNNVIYMNLSLISTHLFLIISHSQFTTSQFTATEHPTDQNTIVFKLKQECKRNPKAAANETDPKQLYINHNGNCLF